MTDKGIELSTSCNCSWEDLDLADEEHGDNEFPDCEGDVCWTPVVEFIDEQTESWLARNPSEAGYLIIGNNMGWRHELGLKWWSGDSALRDEIGIRGPWTQNYIFDDKVIRIRQSHHDAPTGESYEVSSAEGQVWQAADEDDSDSPCANCGKPYATHSWSGTEYGPMLCGLV